MKSVHITNFKGISSLVVDLKKVTVIRGANASGKTSIADAIAWVLTGKDSEGRSPGAKGFEIKPRGAEGLEVSVTLKWTGGLEIGRTYSEKWVKKRGQSEREFQGHEETRLWNGVPVGVREFDEQLNERFPGLPHLFPASAFSRLDWRKQREVLGELSGVTMDLDVIDDILKGNSLDDARKGLKSSRTKAEKILEAIPARIDEASRQIVKVGEIDTDRLATLEAKEQELQAQAAGAIPEAKINELRYKRQEYIDGIRTIEAAHREAVDVYHRAKQKATRDIAEAQRAVEDTKRETLAARAQYMELHGAIPDDACPACGQSLPADQIGAAREQHAVRKEVAAARFREAKARYDAAIEQAGKARAASLPPCPKAPDTTAPREQIEKLDRDIYVMSQPQKSGNAEELAEVRKELRELREGLAREKAALQAEDRVAELHKEADELRASIDELTANLLRLETAEREFAEALSAEVNGKFKFCRWELFRTQINGGIEACCECRSPSGSTYGGNMSHSERIRADVDIVTTLAAHYGCEALPIVIDDAESIAVLPETEAQMIVLEVDSDRREATINL